MTDNKETKQAPAVEAGARDADQQFAEWFAANYPGPDTIIHDPHWHAPRILRAARAALARASEAAAGDASQSIEAWREKFFAEQRSRIEAESLLDQSIDDSPNAAPQLASISTIVREALEAAFEERAGWRTKVAAAVRDIGPPQPASEQQDHLDTLLAVLNAIGYTEEFAAAHPDLKVSEGVKLFLALQNGAVECGAHIGPDCTECGGTGVWTGEQQAARGLSDEQVEAIMEQAQVFASAWSLVGGVFDHGDALEIAEQEKQNLRALLAAKGDGHADK